MKHVSHVKVDHDRPISADRAKPPTAITMTFLMNYPDVMGTEAIGIQHQMTLGALRAAGIDGYVIDPDQTGDR
jgi:hypothetical protein